MGMDVRSRKLAVNGVIVDFGSETLRTESGQSIALRPQAFAVLRYLAEHAGRLATKDELMHALWSGLVVTDDSLVQCIHEIRRALQDDDRVVLKTAPKRGYRLVLPADIVQHPPSAEFERAAGGIGETWLGAASDADDGHLADRARVSIADRDPPLAQRSAAFREASWAKTPAPNQPEPPRLSIVVLPFANIGGDPSHEHFVDGITDSLTTDLSRIRGAFVIGRSTAFTYKSKAADVRQIGRDLNVRYVLEGSVQRSANCMRVNVQLIETETAAHLWAERFDKPVVDLFEMQDEVVSRLANRLGQELVTAEAKRAERSPHPDSMELYFLGLAAYNPGATTANLNCARAYFDCALEVDPSNVEALLHRGYVDLDLATSWLTDDRLSLLRSAEADLLQVLRLRPDDAAAHSHFGAVCVVTGRIDRGVSECERALAIDRNHAHANFWIGIAKYLVGRLDETEAHIAEALRLSPRDKKVGMWLQIAGFAKLGAGRDEEAIRWFGRSIEANPNLPMSHFLLAAASARLGRIGEAHDAMRAGLELNPSFTIARFKSQTFSDNPVYLACRERMYEGLRKAGIPER
jgi:TolB-like protein/DNA-binding winged helix-turn-helix (wHTH) protein/tetratricopeptide (TPR) repeat protein